MKTHYVKFPEYNSVLWRLPALAHVPPAHVKTSFELVYEEVVVVIERVKNGWTGNIFQKYLHRRLLQLMWKQYDATGEGVARTTYNAEGWHYRLQACFSGSTPNIWLLLRSLEKDSKMQKFNYIQETAGLLFSKRPRYEKIKKQMQNFRYTY